VQIQPKTNPVENGTERDTSVKSPLDGKPATTRKSPGRRWVWLCSFLLLVGAAYYAWPKAARKPAAARGGARAGNPAASAIPVVVARAERGDIGIEISGLGAVTPLHTVTVKSRVDGELMEVRYQEGQLVRQGNLLAQIDPRPFEAQLLQAQGQLARDQSLLENARIDLQRYQELAPHNAVPQQQVATQKALVAQYMGAVKTDEGQIASTKLNILYCRITAPVSGRVGLRLVDPGNIVHATDQNGLLVITEVQPISVIFTIPEDQVPTVVRKMAARQRPQVSAYDRANQAKLAQGLLTSLDNQIDPTTGTLKLRATFDNHDGALFPNQFVNVRLLVDEKHGVTTVPTAALQRNSNGAYVYLVKADSTVTVRNVSVGASEAGQTEITSGLSPGDVVVMTGTDKLQEGSKVSSTFASDQSQVKGQ
jgi:membrane fusion protein, multidrug efflux system